jgi:Fe-S-cluster-containing dehydrogenase component
MTIARRTILRGAAAGAAAAVALDAEARPRRAAPDDGVGLLFDSLRCIGCRACVTRCKEANGLPYDRTVMDGVVYDAPPDLNATTKTVVKLAFDERGATAFVKAQCMHCVHPACTSVCMIGALQKGPKGVVGYDPDRCVGCRYCQVACPFNVPKFEWSKAAPKIVKCELCRHRWPEGKGAACADACPRGAVLFGPLAELRAEARRRVDEIPGRYLPRIYGEHEGGGTQVLVLSAVPFERLGLPALDDAPVPELGEAVQAGIYKGFLAPAALYAALAAVVWRNRKRSATDEEVRR